MKFFSYKSSAPATLLRRTGTIAAITVLALVILMFSAVLLVLVMFIALVGGIYLMWKTRELRKQMRSFVQHDKPSADNVIEGEVVHVVETGY